MAQVYAAAGVAGALLLVVLGIAVERLRREVRRLSDDLVAATEVTSAAPVESAAAPVESAGASVERVRPLVDHRSSADAAAAGESVTVITRLDDTEVEPVDLTTARVASVTLGRPLIKATAFSYGLRRACDEETRLRARLAFRSELRRQRKLRRRTVRWASSGDVSAGGARADGAGS